MVEYTIFTIVSTDLEKSSSGSSEDASKDYYHMIETFYGDKNENERTREAAVRAVQDGGEKGI